MHQRYVGLSWAILSTACLSGGAALEGLAPKNPSDTGPTIVWNTFAEPLPDVPFPNDIGTRPDRTSATGRRVNITQNAPTDHERRLRGLINQLEGFSTYAPIWVRFDGRIDLEELIRVQRNDDPSDDAIMVINLNPASADYGRAVPLDLGDGRFPVVLERTDNYFMNDPRGEASNLMLETIAEEDEDADGVLDPREDTDGDGVLDRPNLWGTLRGDPQRMDPFDDLITFYELETDTLIARLIFPLQELSTYAVILTRRLVGDESGSPIRSPFAAVNHVQQTSALRPLIKDGILSGFGIELEDIAFAWTFTTQSVTADIEALRAGLYGHGPFTRLALEFPAVLTHVYPLVDEPDPSESPYILPVDRLLDTIGDGDFLAAIGIDPQNAEPVLGAYADYVDYLALMEVDSPALIDSADSVFDIDRHTGEGSWAHGAIPLSCVVPRARGDFHPPFPVAFYSHGYTSSRFELFGFAGALARFGIATCGIDAFGHGLPASEMISAIVKGILAQKGLTQLADAVLLGRARDLNADGVTNSGGDFWTANMFHTRDVVRQTQLDYFQAIRVVKQFGRATMPVDVNGDGKQEIAGDFNGDGTADFGGEVDYFIFGQSLGGIMSAVVAPLEPAIVASAPSAGGGGLSDVGARSVQGGVVQAYFLPVLGPLITSREASDGQIEIIFDILDVNKEERIRVARVPDPTAGELDELRVGDRVRVTNLDNGEFDEVTLDEPAAGDPVGLFRLHLPADGLDRIRIDLYRSDSSTAYRTIDTFETRDLEETAFNGENYRLGETLRILQEGFGRRRGTPDFRRLFTIGQMVLDPADPVNFARFHNEPMAMRPQGVAPTNLLVINTVGDLNVPVNTGVAIARAAGLVGVEEDDPSYGKAQDQVLIDTWVLEALETRHRFAEDPCHYDNRAVLFDIDEMSAGLDPQQGPHLSEVVLGPQCDGTPGQPAECDACVALPPLRLVREHPWGVSAMRIAYISPTGSHAFGLPDPDAAFDYNTFLVNQVGWFFANGGKVLSDDPCLADGTCAFLPP